MIAMVYGLLVSLFVSDASQAIYLRVGGEGLAYITELSKVVSLLELKMVSNIGRRVRLVDMVSSRLMLESRSERSMSL